MIPSTGDEYESTVPFHTGLSIAPVGTIVTITTYSDKHDVYGMDTPDGNHIFVTGETLASHFRRFERPTPYEIEKARNGLLHLRGRI